MNHKNKTISIATTLIALLVIISITITPTTYAFFTSPDGGPITFSVPCISSMGPGFWAIKATSPTPVVYLYPSWTIRKNYLPPGPGVTTLGLVGMFINCTTATIPPVTLIGRMSIMYGTAIGF